MTEVFSAEKDAVSRFLELVLQKRKRGYRPARSCGNPNSSAILRTSPHDNIQIG
ncbi:hypothetical protein D3C87_2080970 [compost metagenome]